MNVFVLHVNTLVIGAMDMLMPMYQKYRHNAVLGRQITQAQSLLWCRRHPNPHQRHWTQNVSRRWNPLGTSHLGPWGIKPMKASSSDPRYPASRHSQALRRDPIARSSDKAELVNHGEVVMSMQMAKRQDKSTAASYHRTIWMSSLQTLVEKGATV
jgi:hypothetical protein